MLMPFLAAIGGWTVSDTVGKGKVEAEAKAAAEAAVREQKGAE